MTPLAIVAALLLAVSCDYPEAGFYTLAAVDAYGKTLASYPFSVEELVDDTEMTTGFVLVLPGAAGTPGAHLILVPLVNGPTLEHRTWSLALAAADSTAGDLLLDIMHENDILSFTGGYRSEAKAAVELFGGRLEPDEAGGPDRLAFVAQPRTVPGGEAAVGWEIRTITQKEFEKALGKTYKQAKRVDGQVPEQDFLAAVAAVKGGTGTESEDSGVAESNPGAAARPAPSKRESSEKPPKSPGRYGQRPR